MTFEAVSISDVREYLRVDGDANDGQYSDHLIASNIRTASSRLQRVTRRQFEALASQTLRISTQGEAIVELPDLRSATSVTLSGSTRTLTGDSADAWLIHDPLHTEVYTAIQLRPVGGGGLNYRAYSDWFDTNKDRLSYWQDGRMPEDLVITGAELGWSPLPHEFTTAVKVLAAWYSKRPDAVLANAIQTPEGAILDYSGLPPEVSGFIQEWRRGTVLSAVYG